MKIIVVMLLSSLLATPSAFARTWIMENVQNATCDTLPADGISNPADAAGQLRQEGNIPQIQQINGPDGKLDSVMITYTEAGGQQVGIQFFTSLSGCQDQLKTDMSNGTVTDPNSLK